MITLSREKAAKHTGLWQSHCDWALQKARAWQRQVCSRKQKYEPNLVTFQNKKHHRKKPSLWEVLPVDNYRFSIRFFKSYTHKNLKIWHSCFHLYLWWAIPACANTNTDSSLITWSISGYRSVLCNLNCSEVQLELSLAESCCFPPKLLFPAQNMRQWNSFLCWHSSGNPINGYILGSIHRALLCPYDQPRWKFSKLIVVINYPKSI